MVQTTEKLRAITRTKSTPELRRILELPDAPELAKKMAREVLFERGKL